MQKRFELINKHYREFESSLLRDGKLPMRDTGVGFWSSSVLSEVFGLFKKIKLENYNHFIDLGSGDGRVVLVASLFTKATGIETDKELVDKSLEIQKKLGIGNANFIHKNFYDYNISDHDLVFVSPDVPMHRGLESKFFKELRGKLVVLSNHFHPNFLKKHKEFNIGGTNAAVYSV